MKKKLSSLLALSTVCLAAASYAGGDYSKNTKNVIEAPKREPRLYVSLSAGGEFDIHATKFISNGGGDVGFPGTSLPVKVQSRDFTSTHDIAVINGNLEVGYQINSFLTVFGGFTYSHSEGDDSRGLGRLNDPSGFFGPLGGVYELRASISEYQAYTGKLGLKANLPRTILDLIHAPKIITPYISLAAGGKYIESQHARFFAAGYDSGSVELYEDSWVFTGQVNLGYDIAFTPNFSVVFESGYGYDTKPERGNGLPGTSGVNDGGDRLYSNVSLGAKLKF